MNLDDYPELESVKDAILVLSTEQQDAFELEYLKRKKNSGTTFSLCLFFGFSSAHSFYLGNKQPVTFELFQHFFILLTIYLLLDVYFLWPVVACYTLAITIINLFDLFTFKKITREVNIRIACETIKGITESKNSSSTNKS